MEKATTKHEVCAREWLVWMATGAVVSFVAIEAEQGPIALAAFALTLLALFGLLRRLLTHR